MTNAAMDGIAEYGWIVGESDVPTKGGDSITGAGAALMTEKSKLWAAARAGTISTARKRILNRDT